MNRLKKRRLFQISSTVGINLSLPNFLMGKIYQGDVKGVCVPVLNCYSCPAAMAACPIGSLQNFMAALRFNLSIAQFQVGLYVFGFLGAVGSLVGRMPCGWLCPFGFLQDLLYKIPTPKLKIPKPLTWFKYAVLAVMVVGLPLLVLDEFGYGQTWFCKWICPAGTLEGGIPLVAANANIRSQVGLLFFWKTSLLALFLAWMIFSRRPFCRTTCPLGAFFGLFNKISVLSLTVDERNACTQCGSCLKDCPVEIDPHETPNSPECIRCLQCLDSCPEGAIGYDFLKRKPSARQETA